MTIDPLLLARLKERGMEETRIAYLHDVVEKGSREMRDAALHMMSDVAEGPVRHYTFGDGLTAELALAKGIHWTGRELRIAAPQTLPTSALSALEGKPLSYVADFPGAGEHIIKGAAVDASGNNWISVIAAKVSPPAKGPLFQRLRYRRDLHADHDERSGKRIVSHGNFVSTIGGIALFVFSVFILSRMESGLALKFLLGATSLTGAILLAFLPAPKRFKDPSGKHMEDMKALQISQGW